MGREKKKNHISYLSIDLDTQSDVTKQKAKANVCVFVMICIHVMFLLGKRMTRAYKQKRERSRNSKTNKSSPVSHDVFKYPL